MTLIPIASNLSCVCVWIFCYKTDKKLVESHQNGKTLAHVSFHFDLANLQAVAQLCQGLVLLEQEVSWFQVRWLIFFLVPGTVLWFRFNMRIMLVTH